jgi:hypothetical protein
VYANFKSAEGAQQAVTTLRCWLDERTWRDAQNIQVYVLVDGLADEHRASGRGAMATSCSPALSKASPSSPSSPCTEAPVPSQPPRGACGRGDQSPKIAERSGCSSADEQTGSGSTRCDAGGASSAQQGLIANSFIPLLRWISSGKWSKKRESICSSTLSATTRTISSTSLSRSSHARSAINGSRRYALSAWASITIQCNARPPTVSGRSSRWRTRENCWSSATSSKPTRLQGEQGVRATGQRPTRRLQRLRCTAGRVGDG